MIAHHRSTLARADQVINLSQGRVTQAVEVMPSTAPVQADHSLETLSQPYPEISPYPIEPQNEVIERSQKKSTESRLFTFLTPYFGRVVLSILLGFATIASGIGLMASAAYIISAAALHPSIAELQVAIVGIRFFGLSRGVFRYLGLSKFF